MEEWRDVPGWEGFYQVSDAGNIRSVDREYIAKNSKGCLQFFNLKGKILRRPRNKVSGYEMVSLSRRGCKKVDAYVHDLVLLAFRGPKPPGFEVCHGNGIRHDNRLVNLRYGTRSENALDRHLHGTFNPLRGEAAPAAKLTEADVRWIRRNAGVISQRKMAAIFGVSHPVIGHVQRGDAWKHVR